MNKSVLGPFALVCLFSVAYVDTPVESVPEG